jgi:hypothetical protein
MLKFRGGRLESGNAKTSRIPNLILLRIWNTVQREAVLNLKHRPVGLQYQIRVACASTVVNNGDEFHQLARTSKFRRLHQCRSSQYESLVPQNPLHSCRRTDKNQTMVLIRDLR